MKKTVSVEVSKESHELATGVSNIVSVVRQCLADGWQPGTDVPTVVLAVIHELGTAMQGVDKIAAEWQEDRGATVLAALLPVMGQLVR